MTTQLPPDQRDRFAVCVERAGAERAQAEKLNADIVELEATIGDAQADVDRLRPLLEVAAQRLREAQDEERRAKLAFEGARQRLIAASGEIGSLRYQAQQYAKAADYWEAQADAQARR
jgi:chromosome segregation ATPase